jgi:RNA polymerase sigma-70 factor (ECF subfamily)
LLDVETDAFRDRSADYEGEVEARALLEPAFERLGADHRAVLGLHYGIGLSISETAAALGIRGGTAKSRLSAALAALRREMADPIGDVPTNDIGTEVAP